MYNTTKVEALVVNQAGGLGLEKNDFIFDH
jgi:hypothetical protein